MKTDIQSLCRPNIRRLTPYSCARNEFSNIDEHICLDANENPYNNEQLNRYPDPLQLKLKKRLSELKGVPADNIFLGNGSDEAIDLVYRCFCEPGVDNVVAIEPTYGMYKVAADINNVEYRPVLLDEGYQIDAEKLLAAADSNTKAIWICTPNNPTGNSMKREQIERVLDGFSGLVVIDEAYCDFSRQKPFRLQLSKYPHLVVLNTMSKAWGCAALRLGMAFASQTIIEIFNKVKYPYNISLPDQQLALQGLNNSTRVEEWIRLILMERGRLMDAFAQLPVCEKIYPSDANFFLAKVKDADAIYRYLIDKKIVVRNRNRVSLCQGCLRITVGTRSENTALIGALRCYC